MESKQKRLEQNNITEVDEHLQALEATPLIPDTELYDEKDTIKLNHLYSGLKRPILKEVIITLFFGFSIALILGLLFASIGSCERVGRKFKPWCQIGEVILGVRQAKK